MRKTTPGGALDFLYDNAGHKVAEIDTTATFQRGELYAGNRHIAVYAPDPGPSGATFFLHADWLGTERTRTNMTGTACETIRSLPFGDGQTISDSCGDSAGDVSPMHFTGKERDSESGLDFFGARYMSSAQGRFTSPDPIYFQMEMLADPQRWNLYAYARNNPLRFIDPKGEAIELLGDEEERKKALAALQKGVDQAGTYLYENKVTTKDKNGNEVTKYYVGIYTNGPDANGPAFENVNPAAASLSAVIQSKEVTQLEVVPSGTVVRSDDGDSRTISPFSPGATYLSQGQIRISLLDPSTPSINAPGYQMSNGQPGSVDQGIIALHEVGHAGYGMGVLIPGPGSRAALDLENLVRKNRDPNAPTREREK